MKTFLDCIPCLIRQTLDAGRLVTPEPALHERLLREVLRAAAEMDLDRSPPRMAQQIHRRIRESMNQDDPYRAIKESFNRMALNLYPAFRDWVNGSDNPMESALRLAIAANVIDLGVNHRVTEADLRESIFQGLSAPLEADVEKFSLAVSSAQRVLYIADNAGEIVFDRLLIEHLSYEKVTVAVRGFPVLNDATMADAQEAGLTELVEVIDNGSDAPGVLLGDCSEAFIERFQNADLVIAKGQGNYETLDDTDKDIFFLLKAKCPVIAADLGCQMNSLLLRRSAALAGNS